MSYESNHDFIETKNIDGKFKEFICTKCEAQATFVIFPKKSIITLKNEEFHSVRNCIKGEF